MQRNRILLLSIHDGCVHVFESVLETQTNNDVAVEFCPNFVFRLIGLGTAEYSNGDVEKREIRLELGLKLQ